MGTNQTSLLKQCLKKIIKYFMQVTENSSLFTECVILLIPVSRIQIKVERDSSKDISQEYPSALMKDSYVATKGPKSNIDPMSYDRTIHHVSLAEYLGYTKRVMRNGVLFDCKKYKKINDDYRIHGAIPFLYIEGRDRPGLKNINNIYSSVCVVRNASFNGINGMFSGMCGMWYVRIYSLCYLQS